MGTLEWSGGIPIEESFEDDASFWGSMFMIVGTMIMITMRMIMRIGWRFRRMDMLMAWEIFDAERDRDPQEKHRGQLAAIVIMKCHFG